MKVKFNFNLEAWIQGVEIEADSIEEAENKLRQYGVYTVDIAFPKITNLDWIQHWLERKGYTLRNTFDSFDVCLSKRL